ncbi:hypothetical protein M2404_000195 [Rheinheimera pacifica]|nr:hypothetical protein [Rheinheimera pacifica]
MKIAPFLMPDNFTYAPQLAQNNHLPAFIECKVKRGAYTELVVQHIDRAVNSVFSP